MTTDPFKDAAARAAAELSRPAPPPTVDQAVEAIDALLQGGGIAEVGRNMAAVAAVESALTDQDYAAVLQLVEQRAADQG